MRPYYSSELKYRYAKVGNKIESRNFVILFML